MYPLLLLLVVSSTYAVILPGTSDESWSIDFFRSRPSQGDNTYLYLFCLIFQLLFIWLISPLGKNTSGFGSPVISYAAALTPWLFANLTQKNTSRK